MNTIKIVETAKIIQGVWLGSLYQVLVNGKETHRTTDDTDAKAEAFNAALLMEQPVIISFQDMYETNELTVKIPS